MKKSFFVWIVLMSALTSLSRADLQMFFTNTTGGQYLDDQIWITLGNTATTNTGVGYGTNSFVWNDLYANSVKLSDINDAGGVTWSSNAISTVVFVSYGAALPASSYGGTNTFSQIAYQNSSDPSFSTPYQNFEITFNNGAGDGGNLTAINYFGGTMNLKSFQSTNATGPALQTKGFFDTTDNIVTKLAAMTGNDPSVAMTGTNGLVRYIGPTQPGYTTPGQIFGTYPNFDSYFSEMATITNKTVFSNSSAFNSSVNPPLGTAYTNANVVFVLTNQVQSLGTNGYALEAAGEIVTTYISYGTNHVPVSTVAVTNSDVNFIASSTGVGGTNPVLVNVPSSFVYSADASAGSNYVSVYGSGWNTFTNEIQPFVDGGGNFVAANTVFGQILGDISTGFVMGLVGSTNVIASLSTNAVGTLPSGLWWTMDPIEVFSSVQTNSGFYNQYANVIYLASSNSVYGAAYSDRFINGSPQINAVNYNGTNVASWLVSIGAPVTAIPEPAVAGLAVLGVIGFAMLKTARDLRSRPKRRSFGSDK